MQRPKVRRVTPTPRQNLVFAIFISEGHKYYSYAHHASYKKNPKFIEWNLQEIQQKGD